MRIINWGFQYTIYSSGSKVVKKPNSVFKILLRMNTPDQLYLRLFSKMKLQPYKQMIPYAKNLRTQTIEQQELLKKAKIPKKLLANAEFRGENVIQDKVSTLRKELKKNPEKTIKDYINFVHEMWTHKFSETTYNYTINFGRDSKGKVVLIDVGELNYSKEKVKQDIKNQYWLKSWSYLDDTPKNSKNAVKELLNKELTLNKLNKYWV